MIQVLCLFQKIVNTTKDLSEFLKKFDLGNGELGKTPFEIQVLEDGRVISIKEIFIN